MLDTPRNAELVTPSGQLDEVAIRAEIDSRSGDRKFNSRMVRIEATRQQWPFLSSIIACEWTKAEREAEAELMRRAGEQSISVQGNDAQSRLYAQAQEICRTVRMRAEAKLEAVR